MRRNSVITHYEHQKNSLKERIFSPVNLLVAAAGAGMVTLGAGLYAAYAALNFVAKSVINPSVSALIGKDRDDYAQYMFFLVCTYFLVRHFLSTQTGLKTEQQKVQTGPRSTKDAEPNIEAALPGLKGIFASRDTTPSPKEPRPSPNDSATDDLDKILNDVLTEFKC